MAVVLGHGPGKYKTNCDEGLPGSPTFGWGSGRPWKMHFTAFPGSDRIEGWGGGPQWKLVCPQPQG